MSDIPVPPGGRPCPKCGMHDIHLRYRQKGDVWPLPSDQRRARTKHQELEPYQGKALDECLTHQCRICGYNWDSEPWDAQQRAAAAVKEAPPLQRSLVRLTEELDPLLSALDNGDVTEVDTAICVTHEQEQCLRAAYREAVDTLARSIS